MVLTPLLVALAVSVPAVRPTVDSFAASPSRLADVGAVQNPPTSQTGTPDRPLPDLSSFTSAERVHKEASGQNIRTVRQAASDKVNRPGAADKEDQNIDVATATQDPLARARYRQPIPRTAPTHYDMVSMMMGPPIGHDYDKWDLAGLGLLTGIAFLASLSDRNHAPGDGIGIPSPTKLVTWIPKKIKQSKVNRARRDIQEELAQLKRNNAAAAAVSGTVLR